MYVRLQRQAAQADQKGEGRVRRILVVGGASHADWATFRFVFRFVQTSRQHPWGCSRALVAMRMSR